MASKQRPKGLIGELPEKRREPPRRGGDDGCPMRDCVYRHYLGFCDYSILEGHTRLSLHPDVEDPAEINHPCKEYTPGDRKTVAPYKFFTVRPSGGTHK